MREDEAMAKAGGGGGDGAGGGGGGGSGNAGGNDDDDDDDDELLDADGDEEVDEDKNEAEAVVPTTLGEEQWRSRRGTTLKWQPISLLRKKMRRCWLQGKGRGAAAGHGGAVRCGRAVIRVLVVVTVASGLFGAFQLLFSSCLAAVFLFFVSFVVFLLILICAIIFVACGFHGPQSEASSARTLQRCH